MPNEITVPRKAPEPPEDPILYEYAWKPMWINDSNALWVVLGDPGNGKSYASLRTGEKVWPDFSIDAVAANIVDFMELVMDDSYGQGSVIVLEEGGVEASAYDWHSESNEVFRTILETWRHQNRMGIINLPNFKSLDKGARRFTDIIIEMVEAKPWKEYSIAKPKKVNYNNIDDYFTTPFPIIDGKRHKRMRFNLPSQELREDYESLKTDYTGDLNERLYEKLVENKSEAESKDLGPKQIAKEIMDKGDIKKYIKENHGQRYLDRDLIEMDYDIGARRSKKVKKVLLPKLDGDIQ